MLEATESGKVVPGFKASRSESDPTSGAAALLAVNESEDWMSLENEEIESFIQLERRVMALFVHLRCCAPFRLRRYLSVSAHILFASC